MATLSESDWIAITGEVITNSTNPNCPTTPCTFFQGHGFSSIISKTMATISYQDIHLQYDINTLFITESTDFCRIQYRTNGYGAWSDVVVYNHSNQGLFDNATYQLNFASFDAVTSIQFRVYFDGHTANDQCFISNMLLWGELTTTTPPSTDALQSSIPEVIWFQTMRNSIVDTSNWTVIPPNSITSTTNNRCPTQKDQCWALCGDEMYRVASTKGYTNIALTFSIDPWAMTTDGEYCELSYKIDKSDAVWNVFNTSTAMEHVVDRRLYLDEETWDNHGVAIKVKVVQSNGGCCYMSDFYFTGIPMPTTANPTTAHPTAHPITSKPTVKPTANPTTGKPTRDKPIIVHIKAIAPTTIASTANPIDSRDTTKMDTTPKSTIDTTTTASSTNIKDNIDNKVIEITDDTVSNNMDGNISNDNNYNIDEQTMIHIIVATAGGIIFLSCLSCIVCLATICYFGKKKQNHSNPPPLHSVVSTESIMSLNDICSVTSVTTLSPNNVHRDNETITLDLNVSSTPMGSNTDHTNNNEQDTDSNGEDDGDIMYQKGNGKTKEGALPKLHIVHSNADSNIGVGIISDDDERDDELYTVHRTDCGEIGDDDNLNVKTVGTL